MQGNSGKTEIAKQQSDSLRVLALTDENDARLSWQLVENVYEITILILGADEDHLLLESGDSLIFALRDGEQHWVMQAGLLQFFDF